MGTEGTRYKVRAGRASDAADTVRLQASVQLQDVTGGRPHPGIAAWVEGLLDGHPSVSPADFLVAEDVTTGRVAASLVGLRQDWSLDGVTLPVMQVELVGTAPEHRGNRLTELLFAALHERCAADGVPVQMVEGIPYFYRRFGYDYALAIGGADAVPAPDLPTTGGPTVRPATVADAGALADLDRRLAGGGALTCPRDAGVWRYEIAGRRPGDVITRAVAVVVDGPAVCGYLVYGSQLSTAGQLAVFAAACDPATGWPETATAMLAYLNDAGHGYAKAAGRQFTAVRPYLDPRHPLARLGPPGVATRRRGWFVRTGDPVDLLIRLQPLLRARFDAAGLRWPRPELTVDLYGRAARLTFTDGALTAITPARGSADPSTDPDVDAAVPPGAALHLALGNRTLPEVLDTWPDCLVRDHLTEHFLTVAFPHVAVRVWQRN